MGRGLSGSVCSDNGGANSNDEGAGGVGRGRGFARALDVDGVLWRARLSTIGGAATSPSAVTNGERRDIIADGVPVSVAPETVTASRGMFTSLPLSLSPG